MGEHNLIGRYDGRFVEPPLGVLIVMMKQGRYLLNI